MDVEEATPPPPTPQVKRVRFRNPTCTHKVACKCDPGGEDFHRLHKAPMMDATRINNRFSILSCQDDEDDDDQDIEYPDVNNNVIKTKEKMPKMPKKRSQNERKKNNHQNIEEEIDKILAEMEDEYGKDEDHIDINLFVDDGGENNNDMMNFGSQQYEDHDEYTKLSGIMDSGAIKHVTNRKTMPQVPVRPSAGSKRGQCFISATGDRAPNEGEQEVHGYTEGGDAAMMTIQVTDVQKTLFSVSEITDRGNRVIFGKGGGVIHNVASNKLTPFPRVNGAYILDLWIPKGRPFGRQE